LNRTGNNESNSLIPLLQWPEEEDVPGFKTTYLRYLAAVEDLSYEFTGLVAEAFGLSSDGLAQFYGARECMQHRSKVRSSWNHTHTHTADGATITHAPLTRTFDEPSIISFLVQHTQEARADRYCFLNLDRQVPDAR